MGASMRRITLQSLPVLALSFLALMAPAGASAQQQPQVTDEKLQTYAKTFIEVGRIRDEIQAELAKVANKTAAAQEALRVTLRERIGDAIEANGLTSDEYERITHLVSFDQDTRAKFDEMVVTAAASGESLD